MPLKVKTRKQVITKLTGELDNPDQKVRVTLQSGAVCTFRVSKSKKYWWTRLELDVLSSSKAVRRYLTAKRLLPGIQKRLSNQEFQEDLIMYIDPHHRGSMIQVGEPLEMMMSMVWDSGGSGPFYPTKKGRRDVVTKIKVLSS